ncbi:MAG: dihydrodipicolinate synthase family protein [Oscillospiraceae bacterium]|nr:dihydrodipicolinate synthase family protein [Oscillospiraceae bacterium]
MKKVTKGTLGGIIPPIITPLTREGTLDEAGLRRVVDHCIAGGVSGVFAMGSTGEAMRTSRQVWRDTLRVTLDQTAGRVPVFCGIVDTTTERALENAKEAEQLGAEYLVATSPFYIQNTCQGEILRHYEKLAASIGQKLVVYNIPGMTNTCIAPETIAELAKIDNVVAFKDSSADWEHFQRCLYLLEGASLSIFNGAEELCAAAMVFGADGCVPGLGCVFPKVFVEMYKAAQAGDVAGASALQRKVWHVRKSLSAGKSWLSAMKYLGCHLHLSGTDQASFPIEPLTDAEKARIDRLVQESGVLD